MKNLSRIAAVASLALLLPALTAAPSFAADQITFAVDAPEVQGSFVAGVELANFNDGCTSPLPFGTFTGYCGAHGANFYAGAASETGLPANGGSGTPFADIAPGEAMDIALDGTASYFGFHWEAGNQYDRVRLYSGDTLLANFSFASLMDALESAELDASGGTSYATEDYFGNPVSGQQGHEPYAYVHIFASEGVTFDRIVMSEDAGSPGYFEFDNMTVGLAAAETFEETVTLDVVTIDTPAEEEEALAETGADLTVTGAVALALLAAGAVAIRRRRV